MKVFGLFLLSLGLATATIAAGEYKEVTAAQAGVQAEGTRVVFVDVIAEVKISDKGTVFLNFGGRYPSEVMTAVILRTRRSAFEDLDVDWKAIEGRKVQVKGEVSFYEGHPRVLLRDREQLKVK